jgi:hypothetical protein
MLEASVTDRIRSSRRLIIVAAALLTAAAAALVLADVDAVHAVILFLLALALVFVAARAVDRPRASIAILHVIGALVFLLGIILVGIAVAIVQGPARSAATFIMFLSGAAEFAAAGLAVAAASRLPGPAASGDMSAWKMRVAPAALLGIGLFSLMFLLLGVKFAADDTIAILVGGLILAVVAGGYSLLATYVLTRGLPRASRNLWIVLALNAVLLLAAPVVLIAEPGNFQGPLLLGIAIISIACSYGGLTLAARAAGRRDTA